MKESSFIQQNKDNWKHYEEVLNGKSTEPDELNDLFIQVTDDLSYARSFYPNRSVRVYLNNLAQKVFLKLYTNRKRKKSLLAHFFKNDIPSIMYSARKELLVSFLVFLLTFCIGVFSSRQEPAFARQILGDQYVDMTNQNIKQGKPMDVYAGEDQWSSFFRIAYNNLRVDMLTFATGLLFSIGTLFVLAYNGVMVGVFQYFFYGTGYFTFTVLTIWLHGTIEIFTIILSATAGLVFGKGLLFPGTYSRLQAFRISAIKGVKIILVVIPLTLTAAFIESFITGQTQTPAFIKISLIVLSLVFILFYFVWLPWKRFAGTANKPEASELPPYKPTDIKLDEIKTTGEIISESFRLWRSSIGLNLGLSFLASIIFLTLFYFIESRPIDYRFYGVPTESFRILKLLMVNLWFKMEYFSIWWYVLILSSLFFVFIQFHFYRLKFKNELKLKNLLPGIFISFVSHSLSLLFFFYCEGFWYSMFCFFMVFPLSIYLSNACFHSGLNHVGNGVVHFLKSFFSSLLINLTLLILIFILFLFITSPILNFLLEAIVTALKISDPTWLAAQKVLINSIGLTTLFTAFSLYIYGNTLHYFSSNEKLSATALRTSVEKIWI